MNRKLFFLVAVVYLCGGGGGGVQSYKAQAQLIIDVYPSQDSSTNTLWIFSGSSSGTSAGMLRTSGNFDIFGTYDSWQTASDIYDANKPSNQTITLSPLFSSANTIDIDSVRKRIPGGGRTNVTFAASATNTPTITIGSGSRTIASMFMNDVNLADNIGIRVSSSLSYGTSSQASSWTGSGLLPKPIGDFFIKNVNNWAGLNPNFAGSGVTLRIHSAVIPEPEEYALVFGLFALAFVFFHRHRQKKQRQQALDGKGNGV